MDFVTVIMRLFNIKLVISNDSNNAARGGYDIAGDDILRVETDNGVIYPAKPY